MTNDKQRERLVELLEAYVKSESTDLSAYLLANGAIVPKCKVGDKVYLIDKRLLVWWQGEVIALYYAKSDGVRYSVALEDGEVLIYDDDEVFSTREEAEKALKEGNTE